MRIRASLSTSPSNSTSSAAAAAAAAPAPTHSIPLVDSNPRCRGLDLLALAVLHVSNKGAPEAEKTSTMEDGKADKESKRRKQEKDSQVQVGVKPKRRRRHSALPSRYQDSILQPWKRRNHRSRQSTREPGTDLRHAS